MEVLDFCYQWFSSFVVQCSLSDFSEYLTNQDRDPHYVKIDKIMLLSIISAHFLSIEGRIDLTRLALQAAFFFLYNHIGWYGTQCCFDRLPSSATTFVAIGALQLANVPDHREKFWTINHCWQQNAVVYVICLTVSASFIFLTKSSFPLISS